MTSATAILARWSEFFDYYESIGACLLPVNGTTKQPLVRWATEASTERAVWERWIRDFAQLGDDLGFAMATGARSGIVVLDLDVKEVPLDELETQLEAAAGSAPPKTLTVRSGGGGRHYYFQHDPARPIKNQTNLAVRGVDVRGEGGYIIVPCTLHKSGSRYEFETHEALAPCDWLANLQGNPARVAGPLRMVRLTPVPGAQGVFARAEQQERLRVAAALNFINADCDYQTWRNVGFALDASNHPDARELWVSWSETAPSRFPGRAAVERMWDTSIGGRSIVRDGVPSISVATIYHLAKQQGWDGGIGSGAAGDPTASLPAPTLIEVTNPAGKRDFADLAREASVALFTLPHIYILQDAFVEVTEQKGNLRVTPLSEAALTRELCRAATWVTHSKGGGVTRIEGPTPRLVSVLMTMASDPSRLVGARVVRYITHAPFMLPSGEVFEGPGYEPGTETLVGPHGLTLSPPVFSAGCDLKRIAADCYNAVLAHFDEVPFAADDHRAGFVSLLLTLISRPLLGDAPAPMFIVNANTAGAGKTRLAQSSVMVSHGSVPPISTLPVREEEVAKRVLADAVAGTDFIIFDNVRSTLGGAAIESAITSGEITGRILGATEVRRCSLRMTWIATGNNCEVTPDMVARCIEIYLDSQCAEPRESTFRISEAEWWASYLPSQRANIISNLLGILQAHTMAGAPPLTRAMGSFGTWANRIAAAVYFASGCNPVDTQHRLREAGDSETDQLRTLLEEWPAGYSVTAADLLRLQQTGGMEGRPFSNIHLVSLRAALEPYLSYGGRPRTLNSFSRCLNGFENRVVRLSDGTSARFIVSKDNSGTRLFSVERIGGGAPSSSEG
jgi:hypothetical protein